MGKMELGFVVSLVILLLGILCDAAARNMSLGLGCVERERRALLSFRSTLAVSPDSISKRLLPSWNSNNMDCCTWEGVTCHIITGHVISLDLTRGHAPFQDALQAETFDYSLLELKHLTYLDLSGVHFESSKFPANLSSLEQLHYLNLSSTLFHGVVPQNLGNLSSLRTLDLGGFGSYLRADDLMWVTRLSSLEHLDMSSVNLSMATHVFELLSTIPSLQVLRLSWTDLGNTHLPQYSSFINNNYSLFANLQRLDLSRNYFQGEFPRFLQNMTSLRFLDLYINLFNFSGTHFHGLKNLVHLKSLNLDVNSLYGDISGLFKNLSRGFWTHSLESLSLRSNKFYGEFPQHQHGPIGKLSALTYLDISANNLSGPLPSWLPNLTSLTRLILSRNQLSGEIPISMGQLANLEAIDISFNRFETELSEAHFARLSKLQELHAESNKISFGVGYDWVPPFQLKSLNLRSSKMGGQFPQWLQSQKALSKLDLSNCSITGSLPAWLHSMNSLEVLDVSYNNITGPIPQLSTLNSLDTLYLSHNNIWGSIPELSSSLHYLDLSDNMITHLPSDLGHMIRLVTYLNLARNLINGSIPDSLCQIKELRVLDLSMNHLSGNLPNCWPNFSNLLSVRLTYNELTGVIPKSIGVHSLQRLHLAANNLTGQLPSTLKNCKNLQFLDVGENNLSGNVPKWIGKQLLLLQFLRLRSNELYGTIPHELCQLAKLQVIDLANNKLTGNIPHCFGNFSSMLINHTNDIMNVYYRTKMVSVSMSQVMKGVELEYTKNLEYLVNVDLSSNHLVGEIPWELTNLSGLIGLNLSRNHLRGEIPAKIGDMKSLESLDLSNNYLWGTIPASLSNLGFLSRLNLSNNNLSGQIPAGRQLQTLDDPSIYGGNPQLCGAPLQSECVKGEAPTAPGIQNHREGDEDRADRILFSGFIIAGFATGFWMVIGAMFVKTQWRHAYFSYIEAVISKMLGY